MRRLWIELVVAAATVLVPTWALAGNQEVAERIAANLRDSGQMQGYKIGVKFQDGTAWLKGQVSSPDQMNSALRIVSQTPGVTNVVNNITVAGQPSAESSNADTAASASPIGKISQALKQTTGAMAPERVSRPGAEFTAAQDLYRDGNTQSAQQLQTAAVSRIPSQARPMVASYAERVPGAYGQGGVQPTAAMTASEAIPAQPRAQRQPIPIAYAQPTMAPQAAEGAAVPQPAPAGAPQPIPAGAQGPMPIPAGAQGPMPQYAGPAPSGAAPATRYDQPYMPNYAWPGYCAYPNYAGVTYPKQYSPMAWPYIGPFYPYPQAPLGWRKVTLQWHDGWWFLDFDDCSAHGWFSGLFRHHE